MKRIIKSFQVIDWRLQVYIAENIVDSFAGKKRSAVRNSSLSLVVLTCCALLTAQTVENSGGLRIVTDSTLVVIPVSVSDQSNRFVLGLDRSDFTIYEDDVEQKITHFSGDDAPLSIGLLFDTSGSMGRKLDMSHKAVSEFLKTMNSQDEAFLIPFSSQATLAQEFTPSMNLIESKMAALAPGGLTALFDAAQLGVGEMAKAKNPRKALLIVSDGGDNHSRYTPAQIKELVRQADTQIYAMGMFEPAPMAILSTEEVSGPKLLAQIADQTGGRAYGATDFDQLRGIAEKIAIELRNQYVLAYSPSNQEKDGKYHHVTVKVRQPEGISALKVRWRTGYYAPLR